MKSIEYLLLLKRRVIPYWHLQRLEKLEVMETVEI